MEIVTKTEINAPKALVWELLADFPGWDRWSPVITHLKTTLTPGAKVTFKLRVASGPLGRAPVDANMLWVRQGEGFSWVGPRSPLLAKLVSGEHWFMLEAIDERTTQFHHGERFTGALIGVAGGLMHKSAESLYTGFNAAFKEHAEGVAARR